MNSKIILFCALMFYNFVDLNAIKCPNGFKNLGSACLDIDECKNGLNSCGNHAFCINIPGSYKCECEFGYIGLPPLEPCKIPCDDVNCGQHGYCKSEKNGSELLCDCEEGYSFLPSNISRGCVDINECDTSHGPSGICGLNARCINKVGDFDCLCPSGLSGDPYHECVECGKRYGHSGLIFGGKEVKIGDWPWLVALVHKELNTFFCSGSLVSSRHVLTGLFFSDFEITS
jgi:hypothetical protein